MKFPNGLSYLLLLQQEKFIVMENYHAQSSEEMTVYKNDVVFFISKHKKDPQLYNVRNFSRERSGYVPISLLKKLSEGEEVRKSKNEGIIFVCFLACGVYSVVAVVPWMPDEYCNFSNKACVIFLLNVAFLALCYLLYFCMLCLSFFSLLYIELL